MSDDSQGFFSDPKVAISLLALLISIASLIWTLASQSEQNRRWDVLNLSRVELTDVGFIIWREVSKEEALSINWGHKPTLFAGIENRVYTGKYRLPYELVLVDSSTKNRITGSNGFFTLQEAEQEVLRLGLRATTSKPAVFKHYSVQFDFKNTGSTIATDTKVNITSEEPNTGKSIEVFNSLQAVDLLPSTSINVVAELYTPITTELPAVLKFTISLIYKDAHKKEIKRDIPVTYDSTRNYWTYGR